MITPLALIAFPGVGELLVILVLVLVLFGGAKLPQAANALGKAIHNFRKGMSGNDAIDVTPPHDQIEGPSGRDVANIGAEDSAARRR